MRHLEFIISWYPSLSIQVLFSCHRGLLAALNIGRLISQSRPSNHHTARYVFASTSFTEEGIECILAGSMIGMPFISSTGIKRHNVLSRQIRVRRRINCPLHPCRSIGSRMSINKMLIFHCRNCDVLQPCGFAHSTCAGAPVCHIQHPAPSATPCVLA